MVDLQYCDSFRCTAKWFSYLYTCIYSVSNSFPIQVITEYWAEFPVLYTTPCWLSILNTAVCTCQSQTTRTTLNSCEALWFLELHFYPSPCQEAEAPTWSLFSLRWFPATESTNRGPSVCRAPTEIKTHPRLMQLCPQIWLHPTHAAVLTPTLLSQHPPDCY